MIYEAQSKLQESVLRNTDIININMPRNEHKKDLRQLSEAYHRVLSEALPSPEKLARMAARPIENKGYPDELRRDIANVTSYINAFLNSVAMGNIRAEGLAGFLRDGAEGKDAPQHQVSFAKALSEVSSENIEEFKKLFLKLADKIEQDPGIVVSKKIGNDGDWYEVASEDNEGLPVDPGVEDPSLLHHSERAALRRGEQLQLPTVNDVPEALEALKHTGITGPNNAVKWMTRVIEYNNIEVPPKYRPIEAIVKAAMKR